MCRGQVTDSTWVYMVTSYKRLSDSMLSATLPPLPLGVKLRSSGATSSEPNGKKTHRTHPMHAPKRGCQQGRQHARHPHRP